MEKVKSPNKKALEYVFAAICFCLFTLIMYLSPHSVDDVYYDYLNLSSFGDILSFSAGYGNGRVLGNMLAIFLCKSQIVAALVRSVSFMLLPYFLCKLVSIKRSSYPLYLLCFVVFLGIGDLVFGEIYSWISAFSNYFLPVLFAVICIYLIKCGKGGVGTYTAVVIFGFLSQLFSENSTLNNFVIALVLTIYAFIKLKEKRAISFAYLISTALGAAVMVYCRMFISDSRSPYSNAKVYEIQMSLSYFSANIISNALKYLKWLNEFRLLTLLIAAACIILLVCRNDIKFKNKRIKPLAIASLCALPIYSFVYQYAENNYYAEASILNKIVLLLLIFAYGCALIFTLIKTKNIKAIAALIFAAFTAGYFLLLSAVNSRCLFYTYVVLVGLLLDITIEAAEAAKAVPAQYIYIYIYITSNSRHSADCNNGNICIPHSRFYRYEYDAG